MFARFNRLVSFLFACVLALSCLPRTAQGLSGPIALGFAASYPAPDGTSCTHRGIDLSLSGGSTVDAPRAGTVRFAGRVPGPQGGTVLAVTLDTAEGSVTMLPLAALDVDAGQRVELGEKIGELAASGDPSSPASHLHLGLKHGGVYVDPTVLLAVAAPAADPQPSEQPAASPSRVPALGPSGSPVVAAQSGAVALASPSPAAAPAATPVPAGTSAAAPSAGGLPSGVTLADGSSAGEVAPVRLGSTVAHATVPRSSRVPQLNRASLAPGLIALVASALSACCFLVPLLLTRRAIASRVVSPPVSDRLGILLQHLKAGDTLRGLTSCSGPTAFTVPGPPAQRR